MLFPFIFTFRRNFIPFPIWYRYNCQTIKGLLSKLSKRDLTIFTTVELQPNSTFKRKLETAYAHNILVISRQLNSRRRGKATSVIVSKGFDEGWPTVAHAHAVLAISWELNSWIWRTEISPILSKAWCEGWPADAYAHAVLEISRELNLSRRGNAISATPWNSSGDGQSNVANA